jgi:hypothetical protein
VAIVQVSQITNRKGLAENLPQLAGAEFGWATDERRLFIGNGTLADGAPVIGNTEILTEFSTIPVPTPTTATLTDNTASPATAIAISANAVVLAYTVVRNNTYRAGTILVAASGAGVQFNDNDEDLGPTGITFSAIYSGGQILIQYTSTATGHDAQLNYVITISA